jgi:hypothetical protein
MKNAATSAVLRAARVLIVGWGEATVVGGGAGRVEPKPAASGFAARPHGAWQGPFLLSPPAPHKRTHRAIGSSSASAASSSPAYSMIPPSPSPPPHPPLHWVLRRVRGVQQPGILHDLRHLLVHRGRLTEKDGHAEQRQHIGAH